jgi:4-amino-4-deoxy-L-arabinose transferase-like glycosyltransferase
MRGQISQPMTRTRLPAGAFRSQLHMVYLCLVVAIGFGLRVAQLDNLPLSLSLDEAVNGIDALRLFRAGWLIPFLQNNFGRETLFFYLQSFALQLYGISVFSLRFVSVLIGTLTIPLVYAVGQRLKLNNLAPAKPLPLDMSSLLAATGLAISYWHIYFSRVALRGILLPPVLLGLVWCFWRGWYVHPVSRQSRAGRQRRWLFVAGFLLGLTSYTYLAARLLPLLFIAFVVVELIVDRSSLKRRIADFLVFGLASTLTVIPLALYFYQNPQALGGRTQTISVFAGDTPLQTLGGNLAALFQIYFLGGTWLGQWPALNVLSAVGFLSGLIVCLFHLKKAACRFLLLWWVIGVAPMLLSQQNWGATTTILRSILAWPALFLISGIGLTTLANLSFVWIAGLRRGTSEPRTVSMPPKWIIGLLLVFLSVGLLASLRNYFLVWATTYNKRLDDDAIRLAQYLNAQTSSLSLIPLTLFKESATNFLLQARYPNLSNIDGDSLHILLESNQQTNPEQVPGVYLVPDKPTADTVFVLLVPSINGHGTAYLLPPLTAPQIKALATHAKVDSPLSTILNGKQETVAHVYPLSSDASFLPDEPIPLQPIQANFNGDVWLTGYHIEPAVVKPGEAVTLYLNWRMQDLIDGDYYLFLHMFDTAHEQRRGQSNLPLNSIIHRWSGPLTFLDTYHFWLPPDSPEGIYRFEIGLYHNFSLERLPVIIGEANQPPDDRIILGKFQVQLHPPSPPEYPIYAQFGDSVALIGGDFPKRTLQPGQTLTYTLHWQAIESIDRDYSVFNHVLDSEGNIRAQQDNMPQEDRYPTTMWDPGEIVLDTRAILLPSDLEPDHYTLRIGLYEPETGQRLPLVNGTQDFVELQDFVILEAVE